MVFSEEGEEVALVGEGEVACQEAVLLRELGGEGVDGGWGAGDIGFLEDWGIFIGSVCWFALRSDWDAAFFAKGRSIVEAHLIEVIRMEGI